MKVWLKVVITFELLSILLIDLNECNNKSNKKDCSVRKFEENVHTMFVSLADKTKTYPKNEKEMDKWCKALPKAQRFVKVFANNCLKGLSRPTIAVMVYNAEKSNKVLCKKGEQRTKFIAKGVCGDKGKDGTIKCWNGLLSIVETVKNITNPKDKLPTLCCTFYFFDDCVYEVHKKLYPRYCSSDNLEHTKTHLKAVAMDSFRLICSEFEDRDKCVNYMHKLAKYGQTGHSSRYTTPFPGMFEILGTI